MGMPGGKAVLDSVRKRMVEKGGQAKEGLLHDLFNFQVTRMPEWVVKSSNSASIDPWDDLHKTVDDIWAVGVAVTLTAIWRRNMQ
jgi:hypothetical protein